MKKKTIIVLCIVVVALILLVPIPMHLKDGGSVKYNALLYSVTDVHRINLETDGYEDGTIIKVLGFEIYNDVQDETEEIMKFNEVRGLVLEKGYTQEEIEEKLKGEYRDNILVSWGEPDGMLSGMWGDVWFLDEEKERKITVYYDSNGYVENVRIGGSSNESETVVFHDKVFNKSELSEETLEWLEKYNLLSPEEQLSISFVPSELRTSEGGEVVVNEYEVEKVDYSPMVMFNNVLYTAASYSGEQEEFSLVGKIESCIDYGVPTENNQANDDLVGCEIYTITSAPDYIFVLNNGSYSPYKTTEDEGIE